MKRILISVILVIATLSSCSSINEAKKIEIMAPTVKVELTKQQSIAQTEDFTGSILPYSVNKIGSAMSVRINKLHVDIGDRVEKGQILVEMDKKQLLQSITQFGNLEVDYLRTKKLFEEGGAAKQQLDQLETQFEMARYALEDLKENINLTSPISGVVTERLFDVGDLYSPSVGRILTVMEIGRVKVQVNVSEEYFPQINVGMPVNIYSEVYPNEVFSGTVSLRSPALDSETRSFMVEITIPNDKLLLRPGMYSRVEINFGSKDRILVSDMAVRKQMGTNERFGFVIKDGKAERRFFEIGRVVGKNIEIISGLELGETVVIAGGQKLIDGSDVKIVK